MQRTNAKALIECEDRDKERTRLTHEALADVDAGRVLDHRAMQAWATSVGALNPLSLPVEPG